MKTVILVLGLGMALLVMGLSSWPQRPSAEPVATPSAPRGVGGLGRIEPGSDVRHIHAPSVLEPPVIAELRVAVGQQVAVGEVLAVLDSHPREAADLEQARTEIRLAEKSLAKVRAGAKAGEIAAQEALLDQSRRKLELAERQLDRVRKLIERNATSQDDFDVRQSEVNVLRHELLGHEARLAAISEVRQVDVEHAEAEVARAKAALQRAVADLAFTEVRSPIAGEILKINNRAGERIGPEGLLELGDTSQMHVVAEIHEADILRVKLNQRASILLREQQRTLQGSVIEIGRLVGRKDVLSDDPVDDIDARVVEVRIVLDEPDSQLVSGLSYAKVEVTIDTEGTSAHAPEAPPPQNKSASGRAPRPHDPQRVTATESAGPATQPGGQP